MIPTMVHHLATLYQVKIMKYSSSVTTALTYSSEAEKGEMHWDDL